MTATFIMGQVLDCRLRFIDDVVQTPYRYLKRQSSIL